MTQYTDSQALNGLTFDSSYFYSATAVASGSGSINGRISYDGIVTANGSASIGGTISSSGDGYFTVTSASGTATMYQVLGSTADGNNLIFETAQSQGSNSGPYFVLSGTGASPGTAQLTYNSNNSYAAPAPVCFAAGTLIATARGEVAVESLAVGDIVVTAGGSRRPIRWTGSTRIRIAVPADRGASRPNDMRPIAFARGALGDDIPSRELLVSPGHRMLIDGHLFQAESLVNGLTIVRKPVDTIDYHHIELDEPDAVLANGAAAESFVDVGNRARFNDAVGLPSAAARLDADPLTETFAPNIKNGPRLAAVRAALLERALTMGWSRVIDGAIAVEIGGARLEPAISVGDRHWFILPEAAAELVVRSAAAVCSAIKPGIDDDRRLGVQILGVIADGRETQLYAPAFAEGFHDCEEADERHFRWTDGGATLRFARPVRMLEILVGRGAEIIVADRDRGDRPRRAA